MKQQCNFRAKKNNKTSQLTSSALNQPENIVSLPKRHLEAFWCVEGDLKIAWWLGEGFSFHDQHSSRPTSCPEADSWAGVSPSEYISGSQSVVFNSCYCIQVTELPLLTRRHEQRRRTLPSRAPSCRQNRRPGNFTMTLWYYGPEAGMRQHRSVPGRAGKAAQARWSGLVYPFSLGWPDENR